MKFTFGGDAETTYAQFIDIEKGSTLVAEPGKTYDIAVAEGHAFRRLADEPDTEGNPVYEEYEPLPPDDRWKSAADTPPPTPRAGRRAAGDDTPKENG